MVSENRIDKTLACGLDEQKVGENRGRYGRNVLTPPQKVSLWKLYLEKYKDPIIIILVIAAFISLILAFVNNEYVETIGIFAAIFLATTIGFYFERDASKKFDVLTAMGEEQPVKVRRSGHVTKIPRRDVVVGDVVLIETGDEVPADGILFVANALQINESALTGEPMAEKSVKEASGKACDDNSGNTNVEATTYACDMVLRSTMVMAGYGEFVVTAVGDATEIGKVARKSTEMTSTKTPLSLQLDKLASLISKIGSAIAVLAFLIFLVHDILSYPDVWSGGNYLLMAQRVLGYFMMAVTLIVMAVPEGLPMAVTLSLALSMRRMLKSNNLVRKLHASETMGAVTVICTDKTGTLTENKMQVGDMVMKWGDERLLAQAIAVNSTAQLDGNNGVGNPTEVALLLWLKSKGYDYQTLRSETELIEQVPFSTEKKYMLSRINIDGKQHTIIKGAPEIVIAMCDDNDEAKQTALTELQKYQNKAMRTLVFSIDGHLQALAAISDPIRKDVPEAVGICHNAGIEVKVVTGDTMATALEIGRQIHLFDDVELQSDKPLAEQLPADCHITGPEWSALSDDEAMQRAKKVRVMSRARPTDKQRLVELLQRQGEVVAVTGDGTNDAPALNYAHVGLSLGSGTSVAKEASDITLLDDSFHSIANAVMWGRSLYKNIQRFLFFQLVVNLTALLLVLTGGFVGTEMPLTVTQILWVNLIMDTFAAMALASLPPSPEVMNDKPRKTSDFIISRSLCKGIVLCGLLFFAVMFVFLVYCERSGSKGVDTHELTLFFTTFVMLQFWNLFNAKALGTFHSAFKGLKADKGLLYVLLIIFVGQWAIVTFGGEMFRTVPLSVGEWGVIAGATSSVLWIGELYRLAVRMKCNKVEK